MGSCTLSLTTYVILPPAGDAVALKIRGDLDVAGLEPGETTAPCRVDDLEIVVRGGEYAPFKRGDANSDGKLDISDVLYVLGYLFLGTRAPECLAASEIEVVP